ncbi:uncharacterized protein LOC113502028 [Trichoplusia ni]|uniref:Uncharacterized protein LOC113502028 n=1 Tax=Trichoplusia ni TaxID=7111 RepID=A0A7E5WGD3_TRINI|nr:uncharacterized protein LOC113502028 [Trichoplusia ni]
MTLMVRRSESDSDSSGSPCAECNSSVSYRMPVTPGKEEVFRAVTDSSAESAADARSMSAARHERHERHDKARRRPRRHHTPTSSRYQQRQEQERRDFTIHV